MTQPRKMAAGVTAGVATAIPNADQLLFTHVINPFTPRAASHDLAQKVTFAAIGNALKQAAASGVAAESIGVVLPEDASVVLPPVRPVVALQRTVMDFGTFAKKRAYPLFSDVLGAAHAHGRGQYLIYTNIDISPQPNFYVELKRLIEAQQEDLFHPFVVTRRSLVSRPYNDVSELPQMYQDPGTAHPGYDCFVFPREWVSRMRLAAVCIGAWWFDLVLLANLDTISGKRTLIYKNLHLTFHVGDDPQWLGMDEFAEHNAREAAKAAGELRASTTRGAKHFASWLDWLEVKLTGARPRVRRALIEWRNVRQKKAIARRSGLDAS